MVSSAANNTVKYVESDPQWFIPYSIVRPPPDPDTVQHYAELMEESLESRTRLTCTLAWKWPALMKAIVEYKKIMEAHQWLAGGPGVQRPTVLPAPEPAAKLAPAATPAARPETVPEADPAAAGRVPQHGGNASSSAPAPGLLAPPLESILIQQISELEQRLGELEQEVQDMRRLSAKKIVLDLLGDAGKATGPLVALSNSGDLRGDCQPGADCDPGALEQ